MKAKITLLILLAFATTAHAQNALELIYKKIDSTELRMEVNYPPNYQPGQKYPTIVFFFGGGWINGKIGQFTPHSRYFVSRGMITIEADYRVKNRHGTPPFQSVEDGKSAMRYVRANAKLLGVDPDRIVASGGSAGGHVAAATALLPGLDDPADDLNVSAIPQALVLYNPVIDNGPDGYGYERIGERYPEFSPFHNLNKKSPPTIFFLGTSDNLVPVATAEAYKKKVEAMGGRCEVHLYEGQPHGFFNYKNLDNYKDTVLKTDAFLQSLGYIKGKTTLEAFLRE